MCCVIRVESSQFSQLALNPPFTFNPPVSFSPPSGYIVHRQWPVQQYWRWESKTKLSLEHQSYAKEDKVSCQCCNGKHFWMQRIKPKLLVFSWNSVDDLMNILFSINIVIVDQFLTHWVKHRIKFYINPHSFISYHILSLLCQIRTFQDWVWKYKLQRFPKCLYGTFVN